MCHAKRKCHALPLTGHSTNVVTVDVRSLLFAGVQAGAGGELIRFAPGINQHLVLGGIDLDPAILRFAVIVGSTQDEASAAIFGAGGRLVQVVGD